MKQIIFLLPKAQVAICGGYKIVYGYANYLASKGHNCGILYAAYLQGPMIPKKHSKIVLYYGYVGYLWLKFIVRKLLGKSQKTSWYRLATSVKEMECFNYAKYIKKFIKYNPNSVFVATSLRTSYDLAKAKIPRRQCFYFVQDFENWGVTNDIVYDSYRLPLQKITIATWLKDIINSLGEETYLIPNGFDFNYFRMTKDISSRKNSEIAMLYHFDNRKGCQDAICALKRVKNKIPDLHVNMFGILKRPDWLPEWFSYYYRPDKDLHNEIYNKSAIYIAASKAEGFGLTVGEAMICGCAIACTDAGGFKMMVKNGQTGLLSPVGDIDALAENILKLIQDKTLRTKVAEAGNNYIQHFTWESSYKKMESILCNNE